MADKERVSVKLTHAALDDEAGEIILRGVLDATSLINLKVAEYQREILPTSKIKALATAIRTGSVPDVDLGMRGGSIVDDPAVPNSFVLQDPVYIVDGLQRVTAAKELFRAGILPRLGAVVHFNTNEVWERNRFRQLNVSRVKLSPSILLRNLKEELEGMELLYHLTLDSKFVLHNRVSWSQRMTRTEILPALQLLKAASTLHSRFGAPLGMNHHRTAIGFDRVVRKVGRSIIRENIKSFWELVDECWGITHLVFRESAPQIRETFVHALATVLSRHQDFWDDNRLFVPADLRRKIGMFPITDPTVLTLAGAGGKAKEMLYNLMVDHINSGKRTKHLKPFRVVVPPEEEVNDDAA